MKLLQSLIPTLNRLGAKPTQPTVQLTFSPPLSTALKQELSTLPPTTPLSLSASNSSGTQATVQLPSGAVLTAAVHPAIPQGAQVQLNPADLIDAKSSPTPNPSTPAATAPQTQSVPARIVLPQAGNVTAPQPAQPQPATPQSVLVQSQNSPITHNALRTIHTTTVLQTTVQNAVNQAVKTIAQAATNIAINAQVTAPQLTLPVPPGPVAVTLPANVTQTLMGQILTLTPSAPMAADGTQQATLTPAIPTAGQFPQRTPVTLNLGVPLPVNTPQPAILLPPAATPATPQQPAAPQPQPVLILTGNQTTPSLPQTPHPHLTIQQPANPAQPEAPTPQPTPQPQRSPEAPLPIAARILPPIQGQPADEHTALLATGTTITLKSPQPLATGSIIVADFPITPTAGVQRVLPAESQNQQQTGTTQTQVGQTVQPQTARTALAPGMQITGVVTGQNEEGQPLLTITQPGALAGATVPLTLAEPTTLLPLGAQLNIRVENNLLATILGLTLPQTAQNAFTVNTLGSQWEGLQQALSVLQQQAPTQAANMRAALPQLANLFPGLIQFTNALRTNKAEDAFDTEATRLLKSMGIDLSSDISQLSQLQQRPPSQDPQWRGTLFPYVEAPGEDPRQGGFFWRREKSDDPRGSTTTRFVVEVEMSQLGAMQLDGLVTYPEIWLKLRRTSHPEEGFTENLQAMVNNLLNASDLTGGIAIETTATFPVNPRAELLAQTENPLPTTA